MAKVLVTGGLGFIGSHLVDALLDRGHQVRVVDSVVPQVHGSDRRELLANVEVIRGDIRDSVVLDRALREIEIVFHQSAEVGVGQSMYEISRYVSANTFGTAELLVALVAQRQRIRKLVVASSMSIYGEGAYRCAECGPVSPRRRSTAELEGRQWELRCPACRAILEPMATPETKALDPSSVYAITKQDQEQLCLVVGQAYGIATVALRYFNVYGPRQALSNPYTGVAAIFSTRLSNGQPPVVFEDGLQSRDFTHVSDIVQANCLAIESARADYQAINVGTGVPTTITRLSQLLAQGLSVNVEPEIVGCYRAGDIRHCIADISLARELLGYQPKVSLEEGVPMLLNWVREQQAVDAVETAAKELWSRGLVR